MGIVTEGSLVQTSVGWNPVAECILRAQYLIVTRQKQSIRKEINPEYSLEGLMLKLKFQYFGDLMERANSFENTLMLGKIEGRRRRGVTEDEMVGWHY